MKDENSILLQLIKASLWGTELPERVEQDIYNEMRSHAIFALPASILSSINIDADLLHEWKKMIIQQLAYNTKCKYAQQNLPISVPFVILKGTSAAQYYPHPEYRIMGDIDLVTKREDFQSACDSLIKNGYREVETDHEEKLMRHRTFVLNGIMVEVHLYFAMLDNPEKSEYLDNLIIENINETHVLPDQINGLVILEHISQHLEEGLGFRQIIDWMMFVNECLPDDKWVQFSEMANKIGLEKLAITTTRLCETYLGLPKRKWTEDANDDLCRQLIDYIIQCGNFGNKKNNTDISSISQNVLSRVHAPKHLFALMQERGKVNWKAIKKYRFLEHFAWIYQMFRYLRRGLGREEAMLNIKKEYRAAMKRNAMFESLGVRQTIKGMAVFKDGKYIKK